jgi:UDP-N-acetylglucosamine 4,6-dehydratase
MEKGNFLKNKSILVIGGTGSIGEALVKTLLNMEPKVIRIYSRDEYKQFCMMEKYSQNQKLRFLIGDVRDKERLLKAMSDIDIVYNLAAMKHVSLSEYNPYEAVKTNVIGVQNIIDAAIEKNTDLVIHTSSDKAINPMNTMGATKLLGENLMIATNYSKGNRRTKFSCVRFGNVLGSRGSVIPLFKKQIQENFRITVTHPKMTRFVMNIQNAVDLLIETTHIAKGGETFILKMPVLNLQDMVEVFVELESRNLKMNKEKIGIEYIGLRAGEKMYEELMTSEESKNSIENDKMFIIMPFFDNDLMHYYKNYQSTEVKSYSSENAENLTKCKISKLLRDID